MGKRIGIIGAHLMGESMAQELRPNPFEPVPFIITNMHSGYETGTVREVRILKHQNQTWKKPWKR